MPQAKLDRGPEPASPLPLSVEDNRDGPLLVDANGAVVAEAGDIDGPYAKRQQWAALFAHRVNAYDERCDEVENLRTLAKAANQTCMALEAERDEARRFAVAWWEKYREVGTCCAPFTPRLDATIERYREALEAADA